ncbi:flagellar biosynthesis protein FlhB [Candidatus Woesearchaeota archaeon]|jgi:flagellar biosynthetic protein FlhB|nr:flagellar biosynthesis protein FlhB [Candidatus Woesearchaeota archaeon]
MAEESDQERTEEPTQQRLTQARERGQIPRSRELNTVVVLLTGVIAVMLFSHGMMESFRELFEWDLRISRRDLLDPEAPTLHFAHALKTAGLMVAPILLITALAALIAPALIGGLNFTGSNLQPKFDKLNPMTGLARMVSVQAAVELVKGLLKIILVGLVTYLLLKSRLAEIMGLINLPLLPATERATGLIVTTLIWLCSSLVLIVAIDVPYQLWDYKRQLKMTLQEIKDEMRDSEGKPEVKSRIRGLQYEMSQKRMMEQVPHADVVLTNPTHYAVAIRYDQEAMGAPRLTAKGADLVAAQIRNQALAAGVPLLSIPPLTRALYHSTKLDREIPAGLYTAVAQVLAYIYQLRVAGTYGTVKPRPPTDVSIPEEFLKLAGEEPLSGN